MTSREYPTCGQFKCNRRIVLHKTAGRNPRLYISRSPTPKQAGTVMFIRLYKNWPRFDACLFIFCAVLLMYRPRTLRWSGRTPLKTFSCVQEGQWSCRFHKRNTGILEVIFKVTSVLILHFDLIQKDWMCSTFENCMFFRSEMCN